MEELINKLSEEEKKAIKELTEIKELVEDDLKFEDYEVTATLDQIDLRSLVIVLNLIQKQQEQLQEKDKEIESAYWKGYIERENMSKEICLTGCKYRKEYFTKKARKA